MTTTRLLPLLILTLAAGRAAPLTAVTAVQSKPDPGAPVIGYLKPGTDLQPSGEAPAGWTAVSLPGPFTVYVLKSALTKSLEVPPGTSLFLEPKPNANQLGTSTAGEKFEITGLRGAFAQLKLDQAVTGYVAEGVSGVPGKPDTLPPSPTSGTGLGTPVPSAEPAPAPAASNAPGEAAPAPPTPGPQLFEGKFASTHHWIGPQRPYDWQLLDASGTRIVFLDVHKLLLTEQLDKYIDRVVAVYGQVSAVPGGKDLVLTVESLQLK